MSVLALHVGSDGVTALAVDPDGSVVASGHHELAHRVPQPGWFEHAPEEIWQATLAATRAVLSGHDASELTAVGISNTRDALLLWDRETLGSPRPAIGARDRRSEEVCAALRATGHEDRVRELTGHSLGPTAAAPRLRWLAEHEPRTWALVEEGRYAVGSIDSYLVARMTRGTWHVTDVSNAGRTLLLDLAGGTGPQSCAGCSAYPSTPCRSWSPAGVRSTRRTPGRSAGCRCRSRGWPATSRRRCSGRRASTPARRATATAPSR